MFHHWKKQRDCCRIFLCWSIFHVFLLVEVDCFVTELTKSRTIGRSTSARTDGKALTFPLRRPRIIPGKSTLSFPIQRSTTSTSSSFSSERTASGQQQSKTISAAPNIFSFFGLAKPDFAMATNFLAALSLAWLRPIPQCDVWFSIAFPCYLACTNRFRFDRNGLGRRQSKATMMPLLREGRGPWLTRYVTFCGFIGLLLPLPLCIFAPTNIAVAAAPHLYLTACQVTMESLTRSPNFHPLPCLLNPIGFNAFRLRSLWIWTCQAYDYYTFTNTTAGGAAINVFSTRYLLSAYAFGLAAINLVTWMYNLFVFLLLRVVPQYLNQYEFPVPNVNWKGALIPVLKASADEEKKR